MCLSSSALGWSRQSHLSALYLYIFHVGSAELFETVSTSHDLIDQYHRHAIDTFGVDLGVKLTAEEPASLIVVDLVSMGARNGLFNRANASLANPLLVADLMDG
ncbi:hypothetical protein BX600DRAFT_475179 [Xylariales sp. PMI_506]|nr:hypothetical protein BX600DRAFT_475179 [Xylariales sp. PMI_506]